MKWTNEQELFQLMKTKLFTAIVGDVLDAHHYTHQFLPQPIKPLQADMIVAGRAMPALEADFFIEPGADWKSPLSKKPFGLMFEALDSLKENEVYIASGGSANYAYWGELMSVRAIKLGAAGAVINGYTRDTNGILKLGFPTFSLGTYAQDQEHRGKVVDYGVPIEVGGIKIRPGDIIFGDRDGVLVLPQEIEEEIIIEAIERVETENKVMQAIEKGMSAVEAFEKFGIF